MTTNTKDFKVKNGLIVEGSTATVGGNSVLTSVSVLESLSDVSYETVSDGEVLSYDESLGIWTASSIEGGIINIDGGTASTTYGGISSINGGNA